MIRLCIFDLDGTLSNTLESLTYYCNTALEQCGFPNGIHPNEIRYMVGNGVGMLLKQLITVSLGEAYTEEQFQSLQQTYNHLYAADPMKFVSEYDGVRALLHQLQKKKIQLAVLSNKPDAMTKQVVASLYPEVTFAQCCGQLETIPRKPAPDGALKILNQLAVPAEECLYIGDSDVDMLTGKNAGIRTIGVTWGFREEQELRLAGGDFFVHTPKEILKIIESLS